MTTKKHSELQISKIAYEASPYEAWFMRIGFSFLILVVLGALFGYFGSKLRYQSIAGNLIDGMEIRYDKTARVEATNIYQINLQRPLDEQHEIIQLWTTEEFPHQFYIKQISPQPVYTKLDNGRIYYYFWVKPTDQIVKIIFLVEPQKSGLARITFGLTNKPAVEFNQLVYP